MKLRSIWSVFFVIIWSLLPFFPARAQVDLRVGDILLLELPCYSCQRIAQETRSRFSHSGLILQNEHGELVVAESLNTVRVVGLQSFVNRSTKGATVKLMRTDEWQESDTENSNQSREKKMWSVFQNQYNGLLFDHSFLWNQRDQWGREMLYCSEFIAKFLNHFVARPLLPTPMDFSLHWDFWVKYFKGAPPQGELGNSPASFETSPGWFEVGEFATDEF